MSPYHAPPDAISTVQTALEVHRVDELKQLLPLLADGRPPTRKAELIAALCRQLDRDEVLRELWQRPG
jgi:hypothetical protein